MIRYSLTCTQSHPFDSWFQSAAAYDTLARSGQVTCPVCGSKDVEKVLMAPAVRPARAAAAAADTVPALQGGENSQAPLSRPQTEQEQALAMLRAQVEANSEYVGVNFVAEARKMHAGDIPERSIYGEAKPEEAKKLLEEGVPLAPLPFMPRRKAN